MIKLVSSPNMCKNKMSKIVYLLTFKFIQVFYGVLTGAFAVGIAAPNITYISAARGAAYIVFGIIDYVSIYF